MNKNIIYIIITAILLCIILHQYSVINQPLPPPEIKVDTIYKKDTLYYPKPVPYKVHVHDTLYMKIDSSNVEVDDSILVLPLERKIYQDSTYRAVISGFAATLDTIEVYPTNTTIYNTKTVYKQKKELFVAPTIGVGYGFINRKPDVFLGISVGYKF